MMNDNYSKWLEREKNWINEKEKKYKKDILKYSLLGLVGAMVVFGAIGLLAGGSLDIKGMLQNILIIGIFGIVFILMMLILTKSSLPAKKYIRNLKSEIEDVLSPEEREKFACQMLGIEGNIKNITWLRDGILEGKLEERVAVTEDYALRTSADGIAVMVQLQKVKNIETKVDEDSMIIRSGGFKVRSTMVFYPMNFYYWKSSVDDKNNPDKVFMFTKREPREELSHYLHERKIGE